MRFVSHALIASAFLAASAGFAAAAGMTPKEMADARFKVQTAMALASIARESKDGEALLVAARLLASAGPVAAAEAAGADGKPDMVDVKKMAMEAKEMGADASKAEMVATQPTSKMSGASASTGYWINTCDASGYCAWAWLD